jgi:hypothetical protein
MTGSEYSAAIASLSQLNHSDRALCERLRALRKAKTLNLQDFIRRIIRPSQYKEGKLI